ARIRHERFQRLCGRSIQTAAGGPFSGLKEKTTVRYLHTMVRVRDLDAALRFYCEGLGLRETRRQENPQGKYTLVFVAAADSPEAEIELTWNWPAADGSTEEYGSARNFGHLAFRVEDIYATCEHLQKMGYTISRPPR